MHKGSRMARAWLKEDDGWLDVTLKAFSIAAILVAAHQYYYKVYPVWSKEKELKEYIAQLELTRSELTDLVETMDNLLAYKSKLDSELSALREEKAQIQENHEGQIAAIILGAEQEQARLRADGDKLTKDFLKTQSVSLNIRREAVTAYLQLHARQIFQIQLDAIPRGDSDEIDLKKSLEEYISKEKPDAETELEKASFVVLSEYLSQLEPGVKVFANILGVPISYRYEQIGTSALADVLD